MSRAGTKGSISELYCFLSNPMEKLPYQKVWEKKLGEEIEEDEWKRWSDMVHKWYPEYFVSGS